MVDIIGAGLTVAHAGLTGAGGKMVFVTVSETYDLSTKPNKMSLIAIHTPSAEIIEKTYPGLCMNSKFLRVVKQDVTMACASLLPADPQQIGVESGDIAPQDMFNPILYKAVSTESLSTLEARMIGLSAQPQNNVFNGASVEKSDDVTELSDDWGVYYSLLANRDGFRTANPQAGFSMNNLIPLVFEQYYNFGSNSATEGNTRAIREKSSGNALEPFNYGASSMRGRPHPMPRFNTTYVTGVFTGGTYGENDQYNGMGGGRPANAQIHVPKMMPVYTAAIVMPPCKLNRLYYRMVVRTTLEFSEVRPIQEVTSFKEMDTNYVNTVYDSDYAPLSAMMTSKLGMVDTKNTEITKIMEGS